MFEMRPNDIQITTRSFLNTRDNHQCQIYSALNLFKGTLDQGKRMRLKATLMRQTKTLLDLNEIKSHLHIHGSHYVGLKSIGIDRIIGSEDRSKDFDLKFHPMGWSARDRWISIAIAHLNGNPLPAVELIQMGDFYFVRDGHHRISVMSAFGQKNIDAEIIALDVCAPIPEVVCQRYPQLAFQAS